MYVCVLLDASQAVNNKTFYKIFKSTNFHIIVKREEIVFKLGRHNVYLLF